MGEKKDVALITGVNGFVGIHLANYLKSRGVEVYGTDVQEEPRVENITYCKSRLPHTGNLEKMLESAGISRIYHLAAISFLPDAGISPRQTLEVNLLGTVAVLDAALKVSPSARVLVTGSSKEYDLSELKKEPVDETSPLAPRDFYSLSKVTSELTGKLYAQQFGLDVRFTRSFNHTGPGQSPKFVCSDWARQVASIHKGLCEPKIEIGNTDQAIDFCDVRDVVRAYYYIMEKGKSGAVYNVCSGKITPLKEILDYLKNMTKKKIEIVQSVSRMRTGSPNRNITGDYSKLHFHTGWRPEIDLHQTLDEIYRYWINEL